MEVLLKQPMLYDMMNVLLSLPNLRTKGITLPYDVQQLSKATKDTAALYLACGVDTSKTGFCICAISCSCSCRIDVAAEFCYSNRLAEPNDSVQDLYISLKDLYLIS